MEERRIRRPEREEAGPSGMGGIFDAAGGGAVTVMNGPYAESLPVGGMTVGGIRARYHDRFDIDPASLAVLDGEIVDESTVVGTGQLLRFSRRAGEKGATGAAAKKPAARSSKGKRAAATAATAATAAEAPKPGFRAEIVGDSVRVTTPEGELKVLPLGQVLDRLRPSLMTTGDAVLADGVKAVLSNGKATIWVHQTPPGVHNLRWIAEDSEAPYGPAAKYREVKVALPYVLVLVVFCRDPRGGLQLRHRNECFFRNEPLRTLDDQLLFPALLNCSKHADPNGRPLSWICTQHVNLASLQREPNENRRMRRGTEALLHCLFDTAFNYSSDHHEGSSWFTASRELDARISTVESWEEATADDPLFATRISWHPTGHTVAGMAERIFKNLGGRPAGAETVTDVARVACNHGGTRPKAVDFSALELELFL